MYALSGRLPPGVLLLVPDEAIELRGPQPEALLQLHNIGESPLAFCVAGTSAEALQVQPAEGILPPGALVSATVQLVGSSAPHRLVVHSGPVQQELLGQPILEHLRPECAGVRMHAIRVSSTRAAGAPSGSEPPSESARLVAAERLAILRATELAAAKHRLASLAGSAGEGSGGSTAAASEGALQVEARLADPVPGDGSVVWSSGRSRRPSAARRPPSPVTAPSPGGSSPQVRVDDTWWSVVASHALVAVVAVCVGVAWSDELVGM